MKKDFEAKTENMNAIREEERITLQESVQRYEDAHSEYRDVSAQYLQLQREASDLELSKKHAEIKLKNQNHNCEILTAQNHKFQELINETCAKNEALERELGTQKEILRQFD